MEIRPFETIGIVGAGFMGAQIAVTCATAGYVVWLQDTAQKALERAKCSLESALATQHAGRRLSAEGVALAGSRVRYTTDLREAVSGADLVIEATPERLEVKRAVFAELDRVCPPHAILATNSSSLRISLIEDATRRPERVLNLHYFAPVNSKPVVELMGGTSTSAETLERVRQFVIRCGLTPLLVRRESTGFIFNRVWRAVKKECLRVVDSGVASHEDVDRAWMISYGTPRGPFGEMDMIGLDVIRDIEMVYYLESGALSDAPPKVLLDKIASGELGVKTGAGFYSYPHPVYEEPGFLLGDRRQQSQLFG